MKSILLITICIFGFAGLLRSDVRLTEKSLIDLENRKEWQLENLSKMRWRDAVTYCKNLTLNGKSDWHLPDKEELEAVSKIADRFTSLQSGFYWTSTDYKPDMEKSWLVNLEYGFMGYDNGGFSYHVKCVRNLD